MVIIIASASLMIVLSAFSGLREFGLSFSSSFDPDYKILPLQGKTILDTDLFGFETSLPDVAWIVVVVVVVVVVVIAVYLIPPSPYICL